MMMSFRFLHCACAWALPAIIYSLGPNHQVLSVNTIKSGGTIKDYTFDSITIENTKPGKDLFIARVD
jgi:hypothetical protein